MTRVPRPPNDRSVVFWYQLVLPLGLYQYDIPDYYELGNLVADNLDLVCDRFGVSRGRTTVQVCDEGAIVRLPIRHANGEFDVAFKIKWNAKLASRIADHLHWTLRNRGWNEK